MQASRRERTVSAQCSLCKRCWPFSVRTSQTSWLSPRNSVQIAWRLLSESRFAMALGRDRATCRGGLPWLAPHPTSGSRRRRRPHPAISSAPHARRRVGSSAAGCRSRQGASFASSRRRRKPARAADRLLPDVVLQLPCQRVARLILLHEAEQRDHSCAWPTVPRWPVWSGRNGSLKLMCPKPSAVPLA